MDTESTLHLSENYQWLKDIKKWGEIGNLFLYCRIKKTHKTQQQKTKHRKPFYQKKKKKKINMKSSIPCYIYFQSNF